MMTPNEKVLLDYIYPLNSTNFGTVPVESRIAAIVDIIHQWEKGVRVCTLKPWLHTDGTVYDDWVDIKPEDEAITKPSLSAALPDWPCGCGCTLHGFEKICWRCGAPKP